MTESAMAAAEVRESLARLGLTQTEAARIIGINPRTVRNWCAEPQRSAVPPPMRFVLWLMERCDAWRNKQRTPGTDLDHAAVDGLAPRDP